MLGQNGSLLARASQRDGCVDDAYVREGLREVAEVCPGCRLDLFREETEWRRPLERPLKQLLGLLSAPRQYKRVYEPEGAENEGPFFP